MRRIKNSLSPAWIRTFETTYTFGKETKVNVGVFDEVRKTGKSTSMGSACFEIGEILGARGNIKAKKLRNGGTVFARVTRVMTTTTETLNAQFSGVKLKNVDGIFSKSDPFFIVSSHSNDTAGRRWQPVYRSEPVMKNLNPVWKPFSIPLGNLCGGDKDQPILIEVFDWEKSGKHKAMGSIQTTVNALLFLVGGSERTLALMQKTILYGFLQVDTASISGEELATSAASAATRSANNISGAPPKKFVKINGITKINPEYQKWKNAQGNGASASALPSRVPEPAHSTASYQSTHSAQQSVPLPAFGQALDLPPPMPPPLPPPPQVNDHSYVTESKPTFVDYLAGGTEFNLIVAVDYTGSNGDPRKPGTLHYIHPDGQLNDYEKAITAVGSIVARYDSDQLFPVLGKFLYLAT